MKKVLLLFLSLGKGVDKDGSFLLCVIQPVAAPER
jgi:hypothetical protein